MGGDIHTAVVLTVDATDSSGGAGLIADVKVMTYFKVYASAVVTAITAQNTRDILAIRPLPPKLVAQQLEAVISDFNIKAIKVGLVYAPEIVDVITSYLKDCKASIIVDPVITSTTGKLLIKAKALKLMKEKLFPISSLVTPNVREAVTILKANNIIHSPPTLSDIKRLSHIWVSRFGSPVLITGFKVGEHILDIYNDGVIRKIFKGKNISIKSSLIHGTGTALSAAITASIAQNFNIIDAIRRAKKFVEFAILQSTRIGKGLASLSYFPQGFYEWDVIYMGYKEDTEWTL